jgi:2-dehydro-3-deoxy-D-arabinonate dehydratase
MCRYMRHRSIKTGVAYSESLMRVFQFHTPGGGLRVAVGGGDGRVIDISDELAALPGDDGVVAAIRHARERRVALADVLADLAGIREDAAGERADDIPADAVPAPPINAPEVWAAGLTYERSREAREAESASSGDVYTRLYDADRPELFLKDAAGRRTVGSGQAIAVRADSGWSVPEPELALVLDADGRIVGITLGDDVTARDIEAANPLYLPQAKIYDQGCALGPCLWIVPPGSSRLPDFEIRLTVEEADGTIAFDASISTASLRRPFEVLVAYLRRDNAIPDGTVLMTGTGIVPPDDFFLRPGQVVHISSPLIGTLTNSVSQAAPDDGSGAAAGLTGAPAEAGQ